MKAFEGTVITLIAPRLALTAVVGSEWSVSRAARFNIVKTVRSTHWIGVWVGPITGVHVLKATQNLMLLSEIDFSVHHLVT